MAYAALVSFEQILHQIFDHGRWHYSISQLQKESVIALQSYVVLLRHFLDDFPRKYLVLEERIRNVANEAEDTIDSQMWQQFDKHRGRQIYHFPDLESLENKIESIVEEVMNIKINSSIAVTEEQQPVDSPSSSKFAHSQIIGLEDDLLAINTRLRGGSSKRQIIPIIGMGGIGKTTLARSAFDHVLSTEYFEIRVWITLSQDYSAQKVLSSVLLSIDESYKQSFGKRNESVGEKVFKILKHRRYLIVMDDMWSEKAWDDLNWVFPDDCNGSRIILTTRLSGVADYPHSGTPLHEIRFMNADQSWDLLKHKLFGLEGCPPDLENIGKKIAASCRGLPLAIVVIAGVLSAVSKTTSSWEEIAENVNSSIAAKDGHLDKILSLSYDHLPHHLRLCFLYMGCFPEDYEIRVSKLVKLWVAEGFSRSRVVSKSLEEEAEEYLEDLVKRSLVLVSKRKSNGRIKSCSVHDLVRDLCTKKSQEEKFLLHVGKNPLKNMETPLRNMLDLVKDWFIKEAQEEKFLGRREMENQHRVSISHFSDNCLAGAHDSKIRTVQCFHCERIQAASLGNYKLLRVLVADYTTFKQPNNRKDCNESARFSYRSSKLYHLRYLDLFSGNDIPADISELQNLQTLIIHAWETSRDYPHDAVSLPSEIWKMAQLRHLVSYFFRPLPVPMDTDPALVNLQTLSLVENFKCTKEVLRKIPNLKKLGIFYCGGIYYCGSYPDFHLENLVCLTQLEKLKIKIYADFAYRNKINPVFPRSLKKLSLSGRHLPWEDMTIIGSLPNLEILKLRDNACFGSTWETNEEEFPQLKYLLIDKSTLQHWITESSHFPRLKFLLLRRCWCLNTIPNEIVEIDTLELIDVDNGNKCLVESAKSIQVEQQNNGNNGLQVRWAH